MSPEYVSCSTALTNAIAMQSSRSRLEEAPPNEDNDNEDQASDGSILQRESADMRAFPFT